MTRCFAVTVSAFFTLILFAGPARAQGFISPIFGFNFGGVSGCPELRGCEDKQKNFAIGLGKFGTIFGAETELSYSPKFFGDAPGLSSNVFTWMGNVMLAPKAGPVRPYLTFGTGLMKTHFTLNTTSLLTFNDTALGYNVGGGVVALLGDHFGLRGDLRYFHSFPDVTILGITLPSEKLNYSRISAGIVLTF